jgi:hypothetical protein
MAQEAVKGRNASLLTVYPLSEVGKMLVCNFEEETNRLFPKKNPKDIKFKVSLLELGIIPPAVAPGCDLCRHAT